MKRLFHSTLTLLALLGGSHVTADTPAIEEPKTLSNPSVALPNTDLLTEKGDIASLIVEGADRFLLEEIERAEGERAKYWKRDLSSPQAYRRSIATNIARLRYVLGLRDPRPTPKPPQLLSRVGETPLLAQTSHFRAYRVRWEAVGNVTGEGLLLEPKQPNGAALVAIPDSAQTPEMIAGLSAGLPPARQFARRLAESGCRVLIPLLIPRKDLPDAQSLNYREYLYRSAFELGRHLIGYEVQKVLAGVEGFRAAGAKRVGVVGWGEGGMIALYTGALASEKIEATLVSGYFDNRNGIWQEPIDRNVFSRLKEFGDAELASLVAPSTLLVEACKAPEQTFAGGRGAPATLKTPEIARVRREFQRAQALVPNFKEALTLLESEGGTGAAMTDNTLQALLTALAPTAKLTKAGRALKPIADGGEAAAREKRQIQEIDDFNQALLRDSADVRRAFMKNLDFSSQDAYQKSAAPYRELFATDVIGRFERPLLPPRPRTRKTYEAEKWDGYEVVLDVYPNVVAYGILLVPKGIPAGEKRPVVVCQHGLEGRPQDTIGKQNYDYYKAYAAQLANRGFVTFAPQNLYIFTDRFRTLQRKANPLQKTLFSLIVPQHQQITDWLKSLPFVDGERIGFYGLSYGGKSAMRIPPLVSNYCLSICSADFNEWVWKNASTHSPYTYAKMGEYEIFEFDLGATFNYAEMAALIAPRPFMVERGHFDGVAPDETVGYEFAKVLHLYQARLGLSDRCAIEWFAGPHSINAKGTFDFLHKHLNWRKPTE